MSRVDRGFHVVLLAIGAAFLFEAAKLPFWKGSTPGAGMFPTLASLMLVGVSAFSLIRTFALGDERPAPKGGFWPRREGLRSQAYGLGALVVYTLTLAPLGFLLSTFVFLSLLLVALAPRQRLRSIALAGVLSAGAYFFLAVLLKMSLPVGLLG